MSYDLTTTRDGIITRALRIIGGAGQGETPPTVALTEGAEALNDLVKEWQTDGMPLWARRIYGPITLISGQSDYSSFGLVAPTRVLQAWIRTISDNKDTPLTEVTFDEYQRLSNKTSTGVPSQYNYNPVTTVGMGEQVGTLRLYLTPGTTEVSTYYLYVVGTRPFADFDNSTDVPDFPQHWYNALKWGLADQLAYEYGVGLAERAMISKKADKHKEKAMEGDWENGSMFFQPGDQ